MAQKTDQPEGNIVLKDIKANHKVHTLIDGANDLLKAMGYTEHGHRHVGIVSSITRYILENLGAPQREIELGMIAAYLHDIGNVVNRVNHPMIGASMSFTILNEMGMPPEEIAPILGAIGNHEEIAGTPISRMSAALIIADKSDVHLSRVPAHDHAVEEDFEVLEDRGDVCIDLKCEIDLFLFVVHFDSALLDCEVDTVVNVEICFVWVLHAGEVDVALVGDDERR